MENEESKIPERWTLSTQTEHNHTYHNTEASKTLTLIQLRKNNWQVKGLVGYNSTEEKYPVFGQDIPFEEAKEIAFDVMSSDIDNADLAVEYVSANSTTTEPSPSDSQTTTEDSPPSDENTKQDTNTESSTAPEDSQEDTQQSLTDFVG
jgi:hypothetical protein